ncbi:MAG: DUF1223 domain-containing protein, partial [Hyphococcus sp.]
NIRKRSSVYTPQIVVNGVAEAPGAAVAKVDAAIDSARADASMIPVAARREGDAMVFNIGESQDGGNAYLVTMKAESQTDVPRGENAGRKLSELNIVTGVERLGVVRKSGAQIERPAPGEGETCALLVQAPRQGRIIAAAQCP